MPESPRFLVANKKFDEARRVFNKIAKMNGKPANTADNFSFLKSHSEREKDVNGQELETDMCLSTQEDGNGNAPAPVQRKKASTT
jgi:hypothetical protein